MIFLKNPYETFVKAAMDFKDHNGSYVSDKLEFQSYIINI